MTNEELFEELLYASGGDGWDGVFSARAAWQYEYMQEEFAVRAREANFFTKT